jgi:Ca-activated chloride channel family protein
LPIYAAGFIATLMILALSQPVWRQVAAPGQESAPLLIVVDASQSMLKNDVDPSRNARAHLLLNGLLTKGLNRPVAVLATAGSSHVLLPPAIDMKIVKLYLSYLDPGVMPVDGGDLSDLVRVLQSTPGLITVGTDILLVTDGMSTGADEFKRLLNQKNMAVATLAFTDLGEQTARQLGGTVIIGDKLTPNNTQLYKVVRGLATAGGGSGQAWADEYRWFIIPVTVFLLYFFRRGVTLYWAPAALVLFLGFNPNTARADVMDWFFTADQQGTLLLKMGKYKQAASRFQDPGWKAVACYYAEDWECARQQFAKLPTEAAIYNMATAAAQGGSYKLSRDLYAQLLKINPDYPHAQANFEQVADIVKQINEFSKSQTDSKPPEPDKASKLEKIKPNQIADGAKKKGVGEIKRKQLTAQEVLQSKDMTERWLRDINRDPKAFIRSKFQYEYSTMRGE